MYCSWKYKNLLLLQPDSYPLFLAILRPQTSTHLHVNSSNVAFVVWKNPYPTLQPIPQVSLVCVDHVKHVRISQYYYHMKPVSLPSRLLPPFKQSNSRPSPKPSTNSSLISMKNGDKRHPYNEHKSVYRFMSIVVTTFGSVK